MKGRRGGGVRLWDLSMSINIHIVSLDVSKAKFCLPQRVLVPDLAPFQHHPKRKQHIGPLFEAKFENHHFSLDTTKYIVGNQL